MVDQWTIDPAALSWARFDRALPIAFVDLGRVDADDPFGHHLPPFPIVGLGDRHHPAGTRLDAVVEHPVTAAALARSVAAHPRAAAVTVQLLRSIEGVPVDAALTIESLCYGMLQGSEEHHTWRDARKPGTPPPGRIVVARDAGTLTVLIDRPKTRNAIDRAIRDGLYDAFSVAACDPGIRRTVVRSVGPAFSVGADLDEFGTTRDPATAHLIRAETLPAIPLARCAAKVEIHIQGACIGAGLEIAAFARRVTAAPSAWFQLPELAMGLIPGAGGCVSIARRIGRQRTALMILSGRRIGAATALRWGLIDAIEDLPPIDPATLDDD
ncbi:enoyl-CoA hydratase/isomerase family protein [uncultured Sphingomonas sp.]|uniref:enoyl-CoA hydratase/isomerase family protein n=1 Tax=uncultured Sphingomonas sp. TaxID=158754 RepID=UPI0035CAAF92